MDRYGSREVMVKESIIRAARTPFDVFDKGILTTELYIRMRSWGLVFDMQSALG